MYKKKKYSDEIVQLIRLETLILQL